MKQFAKGNVYIAVVAIAMMGCADTSTRPGPGLVFEGGFPDGPMTGFDDRPVVMARVAPPPISGGTLIVSRDQRTAIAADPDHDVVWRVDLRPLPDSEAVLSATALETGDEPGRVVEDRGGRIHVVLRGGGAIASFEPAYPQRVVRRAVCSEPRGLAYDEAADVLHVACTSGELVTLPAAGGAELRRTQLDDDLRDVVVRPEPGGHSLIVSRFRSAELLQVGDDGRTQLRIFLPSEDQLAFTPDGQETTVTVEPAIAWRTLAMPDGSLHIVHQRAANAPVSTEIPGGYGGDGGNCSSIVQSVGSWIGPESSAVTSSVQYGGVVLPVDAAVSPNGDEIAIASAGTRSVVVVQRGAGSCFGAGLVYSIADRLPDDVTQGRQPVAVAYREEVRDGEVIRADVVVQVRDPAAIINLGTGVTVVLPAASVSDSGHQTFHEAASVTTDESEPGRIGAALACASCHPEGRDDGRIWDFTETGPRRTQSVAGGILGTEPFHWDGEMTHFDTLMNDVFVGRMAGAQPSSERMSAIAHWLDTVPPAHLGLPVDADSVERGRALFEDQDVGCTSCHTGAKLTNNRTVDVGTGGAFQVPSLVGVSARAPYLHDGRAATLRDRFGRDGGGDRHGLTSQLDAAQIDDLVAYLDTL